MFITGAKKKKWSKSSNYSLSEDSSISTVGMQHIVDKLRHQTHRASTRVNYHQIWKKFNEFFIKLDIKPNSWEDRLILFVGFLVDQNRKSSTIKSYISAIKTVLREDGVELNENNFLLKSLTNACRLKNDYVKIRLPITKNVLYLLNEQLANLFHDQPFLFALYKAAFNTAYFGLFRIGELTSRRACSFK